MSKEIKNDEIVVEIGNLETESPALTSDGGQLYKQNGEKSNKTQKK